MGWSVWKGGVSAGTRLVLAAVVAVGVAGCDDDEAGPTGPSQSIPELASSEADLETLVAALEAAGLVDDLSGAGPFTVFAPTDAAFGELPDGTVAALLETANEDVLTELLLGHVVSGSYRAADLSDGQVLTALSGDELRVSIEGGAVRVGGALVAAADVSATNGVVHVMAGVLAGGLDLVERARVTPQLSTLVTAVVEAELAETLGGAGPFTVFAPVNSAFASLDPESLGRLLAEGNSHLLQKVLTYHVVPGRVLAGDLMDDTDVATVEGSTLRIDLDGGATVNGVDIVATDIEVENGVVHLIDEVLLQHLDLVDVAVVNGFDALVGAVRSAGLESALRDPAASLTVFAPTDAAFEAIGPVPTDPETLQPILLYHVVGSEAFAADLSDGQVLSTLQGGTVTVQIAESVTLDGARNAAEVTGTDVAARNGVIHVIDTVLLPPSS
jgi:transforming growth factor-beta-induced protein